MVVGYNSSGALSIYTIGHRVRPALSIAREHLHYLGIKYDIYDRRLQNRKVWEYFFPPRLSYQGQKCTYQSQIATAIKRTYDMIVTYRCQRIT